MGNSASSSVSTHDFIFSVKVADIKIIKKYIKEGGDINFQEDLYGYTALMYACYENSIESVKELVKHGKLDLNMQSKNGNTALHKATKYNNMDIAKLLLDKGADETIKNDKGRDAFYDHYAYVKHRLTTSNKKELETHLKTIRGLHAM